MAADDSGVNAVGAEAMGWTAVHLVEASEQAPPTPVVEYQIRSLGELRRIFPHIFKNDIDADIELI